MRLCVLAGILKRRFHHQEIDQSFLESLPFKARTHEDKHHHHPAQKLKVPEEKD